MINKIFARNLALAIEEKNCMKIDIANALGINKSQVTRYFQGQQPKPDKLKALADYLGCSVDWLIGVTYARMYDFANQEILLRKDEVRLSAAVTPEDVKKINQVYDNPNMRSRLRGYLDGLIDLLQEEHKT